MMIPLWEGWNVLVMRMLYLEVVEVDSFVSESGDVVAAAGHQVGSGVQ